MERSIVIFEGLIAIDKERRYHRNFSQLAYCLKDKHTPDFTRSEQLLNQAIESRGPAAENGWRIYEANRAYVRIRLLDLKLVPASIAADPVAAIVSDLDEVFKDSWSAQWLRRDDHVKAWAEANNYDMQ